MKNVMLALVCFLVKLNIVYSPMIPSSRYSPGIMGKKIKIKTLACMLYAGQLSWRREFLKSLLLAPTSRANIELLAPWVLGFRVLHASTFSSLFIV
jgi:hypothetical protein